MDLFDLEDVYKQAENLFTSRLFSLKLQRKNNCL